MQVGVDVKCMHINLVGVAAFAPFFPDHGLYMCIHTLHTKNQKCYAMHMSCCCSCAICSPCTFRAELVYFFCYITILCLLAVLIIGSFCTGAGIISVSLVL